MFIYLFIYLFIHSTTSTHNSGFSVEVKYEKEKNYYCEESDKGKEGWFTPFCNANRHMSNWIRRNAFDFVKHHASTTSAHSVRQIALVLTLLLFIFDMEHWISAEAFYIDLIH